VVEIFSSDESRLAMTSPQNPKTPHIKKNKIIKTKTLRKTKWEEKPTHKTQMTI
jgi:hypothetical protein